MSAFVPFFTLNLITVLTVLVHVLSDFLTLDSGTRAGRLPR
jgi:hypothetical protein